MSSLGISLHERIQMTLSNASPRDLRELEQTLGACRAPTTEPSDLTIEFTPQQAAATPWKNLGEKDAYYRDGSFAVAASGSGMPVEIDLPISPDGGAFRISCPANSRLPLTLVRSMINAQSVFKKMLGLQATAFTFEGKGIVACGWPRGGKTGALIAFLLQGAEYLAADWAYIADGGRTVHGVPEVLRLRDWHWRAGGRRLGSLKFSERLRLSTYRWSAAVGYFVARGSGTLSKSVRKIAAALDRRRFIDKPASTWLKQDLRPRSVPLHTILLMGTHQANEIRVAKLDTSVASKRLVALHDESLDYLWSVYRRWSYAMPDPTAWIEAFTHERELLIDDLLARKCVYAVEHPPEVCLDQLFQSIYSGISWS